MRWRSVSQSIAGKAQDRSLANTLHTLLFSDLPTCLRPLQAFGWCLFIPPLLFALQSSVALAFSGFSASSRQLLPLCLSHPLFCPHCFLPLTGRCSKAVFEQLPCNTHTLQPLRQLPHLIPQASCVCQVKSRAANRTTSKWPL